MTTAANHETRQGSMWRSAGLDFFEKGFALFGLMFMTGGLTRVLTGGLPEDVASTTSTPLVLLSGLVVYLLAAVFIGLRFPRFFPLILYSLVLWVPVFLALASVYWSVDPGSTFRRATALFGTTLFGVYIALRFSLNELATLLFIALCAIVSVSLLVAVIIPGFGVHQAGDAITAHHAGLWRGLFWHKNKLGPVASILALIIVALWPRIDFGIFVKLVALAMSGIVVVGAGSSQALFQFTVFSGLLVIHRLLSGLAMSSRIALLAAAMPAAFLCFLFLGEIQELVLDLLNRDATLSSRTYIWQAAFVAGREHFLLGNGYNVGWFGGADEIAQRLYYISVSQAHNGYLQIWLELGLVGLASLAVVWLVMIYRVIGVSRYSYDMYITTVYFLLYYFVSNYVTAFLMTYNDLSWVLFSAFFIMCLKMVREALPGEQTVQRFPEAPS